MRQEVAWAHAKGQQCQDPKSDREDDLDFEIPLVVNLGLVLP